jgi:hypothetical protein
MVEQASSKLEGDPRDKVLQIYEWIIVRELGQSWDILPGL